jgi:hypothetical protein
MSDSLPRTGDFVFVPLIDSLVESIRSPRWMLSRKYHEISGKVT